MILSVKSQDKYENEYLLLFCIFLCQCYFLIELLSRGMLKSSPPRVYDKYLKAHTKPKPCVRYGNYRLESSQRVTIEWYNLGF